MKTEGILDLMIREFERQQNLAEQALAQVDDEGFFKLEGDDDCIAHLVKHLAGNMQSRWRDFLSSDGEKPDRDRDREFELTREDSRLRLMAGWTSGWSLLFEAIVPLSEGDLSRTITIRGEPHTALQAITRQLTHYAYHVGQIVLLARKHSGGQWQTLSIPKGASTEVNDAPANYLGEDARPSRDR